MIGPLRSQLMQAGHLREITAEAKDGSGLIFLQFDYGSDIDYLFIDVNERIDRAMGSLPRELERPTVVKASATDIPAFYLNLTLGDDQAREEGTLSERARENRLVELSNFATTVIARRLEQLPEVAFVDLSGRLYPELVVEPDQARLEAMGITPEQIEQAIRAHDINLGNLTVRDGGIVAFITSQGVMNSPRNEAVRLEMLREAHLVSAIRLPTTSLPTTPERRSEAT